MNAASILNPRIALLIVLGIVGVLYIVLVIRATTRGVAEGEKAAPSPLGLGTGFVTNFFDTLGIGSFATTTAIFRRFGMVRDEKIPGTLNFGHTLPTIAQAFIFTTIVPVDPKTLILLIVAAVLGAWVGAGVIAKWPRRRIQIGMGIALLVFAMFIVMTLASKNPTGGTELELTGTKLIIGFVGNLILGALMTLGIGLYAPCMVMIYMLGMNPTAAFPIMMGSCAFLMPVASARFVRERGFDLRASLGLLLGGVPAVLIAAYIVKTLDLTIVRWLVLAVVLYTATGLIRAAMKEKDTAPAPTPSRAAGAAMP
ncbi:MAG TPA: sulfite exporter TauE/SafE family protein [Gemmatimonadaceae bacterium]|nr:sulfite exporter TauE/SafE family protein [Gemmatimonadaceae bacterium]